MSNIFMIREKVWTDRRVFDILGPAEEFEGCHAVAEASDVFAMRNEYEMKLTERDVRIMELEREIEEWKVSCKFLERTGGNY